MTERGNNPDDALADPITNESLRRAKEESAAARSNLKTDADITTKETIGPSTEEGTTLPPFVEENPFDSVLQRGCSWGIFPLLLVIVNKLAWDEIASRDSYRHDDTRRFLADLISNSTLAAFVLFADVVGLYKCIAHLKEEIASFEADDTTAETKEQEVAMEEAETSQQETSTSTTTTTSTNIIRVSAPKYPYAKLTRKLDDFLMGSSSPPPKVPTTIGLLCMLSVCCAAGCLASLGVRIYAGTSAAETDCALFPNHRKHQFLKVAEDQKIAGIPDGLQTWAVGLAKNGISEFSGSYAHMKDGTTYFGGSLERTRNPEPDNDNWRGNYRHAVPVSELKIIKTNVLFSTNQNGVLQRYLGVGNPRNFVAVKGDSPDSVEIFCCTYDNAGFARIPTRRLLRASSGDLHQEEVFRNRSLTVDEQIDELYSHGQVIKEFETIKAYEGDLWHVTMWRQWHKEKRLLNFYKINPLTMEHQSIANVAGSIPSSGRILMEEFGKGLSDATACSSWISTITSILVAIVTFPAAYWLVQQKGIAAGIAPAVMTACYVMNAISREVLTCASYLGTLATTIMLVQQSPKWLDRDMLIWAHYAIFCYLFILAMCHDFHPDYSSHQVLWGILLGAVLNHRTLEGVGITFAVIFVCSFLRHCGVHSCLLDVFFVLPMVSFLAFGMIATGTQVQKYHPYIAFTLKRFFLELKGAVPADMAAMNGRSPGNEGDLTTRLITVRRSSRGITLQ